MPTSLTSNNKTWTISEAKARLSEVLRLAADEGPQFIGTKKSFVVISEEQWQSLKQPKKPLALWLVENMPSADGLELPNRKEREREIPFK